MKVQFSFTIPPETFTNAEQVLTHGNSLIPSPPPQDLQVACDRTKGLTIWYSVEFETALDAARGIVKALKTEMPE